MVIEDVSQDGTNNRAQGDSIIGSSVKIDQNHPLYLNSVDVPGALSIWIQLIEMKNYTLWNSAMVIALLSRNKLRFVDGTDLQSDYEGNL